MQCCIIEDPSAGDPDVEIDSARYERISMAEGDLFSEEGDLPLCVRKEERIRTLVDDISQPPDVAEMSISARVHMLLDSVPFQAVMASCIMLNAIVIGGETDYPDLEIWHVIENGFLLIFSSELLLRMISAGVHDFFARGEDQLWNLFDFTIVGLGIFDVLCAQFDGETSVRETPESPTGESHKGGLSTLFRMIRLLRILRVFKIVRFLKQLYMIFFGFIEAIQAICLVTVLMVLVLYLCSVVMVRTYGRTDPVDDSVRVLHTQFKCIKTSMMSLFELMSNPGNLSLYKGLMDSYPILTLFLVSFVIFGSFGMIALLTGVISESMFDKNQTRVQELRQEREQKREVLKQKCIELFALVDKDANDEASPKDLEDLLHYVREMFQKLDIEYMEHEFENIIMICDTDGNGAISETEFVSGILQLCDGVRAASIQEVYYLVSQMNAKLSKMEFLHDEVRRMSTRAIPELHGQVKRITETLIPPPSQHGARPVSDGATQWADPQLSQMRASMKSTMDEQTQVLLKKIDSLQVTFNELCARDTVFTQRADVERPAASPEKGPRYLESKTNATPGGSSDAGQQDHDRGITPLSPPPVVGNVKGPLGHVSSADQKQDESWLEHHL